jgi:hypothetical protein
MVQQGGMAGMTGMMPGFLQNMMGGGGHNQHASNEQHYGGHQQDYNNQGYNNGNNHNQNQGYNNNNQNAPNTYPSLY